jgi:antitoxin VapB
MALSIKTEEADRLARELARLTGETMTEAVTRALEDRLDRVRRARAESGDLASRIAASAAAMRAAYDLDRPISREEWDAASGETALDSADA